MINFDNIVLELITEQENARHNVPSYVAEAIKSGEFKDFTFELDKNEKEIIFFDEDLAEGFTFYLDIEHLVTTKVQYDIDEDGDPLTEEIDNWEDDVDCRNLVENNSKKVKFQYHA